MKVKRFEKGGQVPLSIRVDKRTKALIDAYHKEREGSLNQTIHTLLEIALEEVFKEKA